MFDHSRKHVRGSALPAAEQAYCLRAYVHRFTREHVPAWACKPRPDGTAYKPHFASDADWLAHTDFMIAKSGKVLRSLGADCYSRPTWPEGQ